LATALCQHAMLQQSTGQTAAAAANCQRALTVAELLAAKHPGVSEYRLSLAATLLTRGALLRTTGRADEAEADWQRALAISSALASERADVPEYRRLLAACLVATGRLPGASSGAEAALGRAATIARSLVVSTARTLADERLLADALQGLAEAHERAGRPGDAAAIWRRVLRQRQRLAAEYPEVPAHRNELAWMLANGPTESVRDPGRAIAEARAALTLSSQDPDGWLALGAAAYRGGAWREAANALQRYGRLRGGAESPAGFLIAMTHWQQGDRTAAAAEFDKAESWYKQYHWGDFDQDRLRGEAIALLANSARR
jgi:tetratricopeptide (TPR) repeat protein